MAGSSGGRMKELFRLMRDVDKLSDGQAEIHYDDEDDDKSLLMAESEDGNEDNPVTFFLLIKPNDGYYKGASIKFKVILETEYPIEAPNVTCCNTIYHPNIDLPDDGINGSVCVNLLGSDWTPEVGLDGCVMAILFLFYNPQLDDALSPVFDGSTELEEFAENVRCAMRGEEIDGYTFDKIIDNDVELEDVCKNEDKTDQTNNENESNTDEAKENEVEKEKDLGNMKEPHAEAIDVMKKEDTFSLESNLCVAKTADFSCRDVYNTDPVHESEEYLDGHENSSTLVENKDINNLNSDQTDTSIACHMETNAVLSHKLYNSLAFRMKTKLNIFSRFRTWMTTCKNPSSLDR